MAATTLGLLPADAYLFALPVEITRWKSDLFAVHSQYGEL